jgi:hypothetical protein
MPHHPRPKIRAHALKLKPHAPYTETDTGHICGGTVHTEAETGRTGNLNCTAPRWPLRTKTETRPHLCGDFKCTLQLKPAHTMCGLCTLKLKPVHSCGHDLYALQLKPPQCAVCTAGTSPGQTELLVHLRAVDFLRRAGHVRASDFVQPDLESHDTVHPILDPCSDQHILQPRRHRCSCFEPSLEDCSRSFARRRTANPACRHPTCDWLRPRSQLLAGGDVCLGGLGLFGLGPSIRNGAG